MIFENVRTHGLHIPQWQVGDGECWAVLGRNGSGKRQLAELIVNTRLVEDGSVEHGYNKISLLSFEQQQAFYEKEIKNDDTEFMDQLDPGTTVRELLNADSQSLKELAFLGLEKLLDRGYRLLSSGESRKVLLASALLQKPDLLILDEPFDSLDIHSKQELSDFLAELVSQQQTQLVLLINSIEEVFAWNSHLAILANGEFIAQGERDPILANPDLQALVNFNPETLPDWPEELSVESTYREQKQLLNLNNGHVSYAGSIIFENIDLSINQGEHTLITGPNGCGKSTLLELITGDNSQCYGNDLTVLGFKRGEGETIWQLKKHIGIVSPELHRNHRVPGSAIQIVLSGFFDSIGLYQEANHQQQAHALRWLDLVGLGEKSDSSFKQLSYGEQRLVLIARALVKQPPLLILDEPTQGLDDINRHRVMYFLEHLATQQRTTIVMVSHRTDEYLSLFEQHFKF